MVENARLEKIVSQALDGVVVEPARGPAEPDLVVRTRDGATIMIEVKWAGEGWPQDVRRAAENVPEPWPADVWLLARHLSPGAIDWYTLLVGARDRLRGEQLGLSDVARGCRLTQKSLAGLRQLGVVAHGRFTRVGFARAIEVAARGVNEDVIAKTRSALQEAGALRSVPDEPEDKSAAIPAVTIRADG